MTGQKRRHSLLESFLNVSIGFFIALMTQIIVFPWFGIAVGLHENIRISVIFTVVSIVRSYVLRRVFNHLHVKGIL